MVRNFGIDTVYMVKEGRGRREKKPNEKWMTRGDRYNENGKR